MKRAFSDPKAYEQITGAFKKNKTGITAADIAAKTGIPLDRVRELVPLAADEFSARLEVCESGEILYSFPNGFKSRYRGFGPAIKRGISAFTRFSSAALKLIFKAWIMVMLLGYFLVFMAIALASLFISVSASSNNRRGGRGVSYAPMGMFNLIIRLWFYSELFGRRGGYIRTARPSGKTRPLHRAIFSFVFGEDDPNAGRESLEKKTVISYIRRRRGVISLPELMTICCLAPQKAEDLMAAVCAEFHGQPEATEEGTVVYRFDEILSSAEKDNPIEFSAMNGKGAPSVSGPASPLLKKLKSFSLNPGKMNFWFGLINGINLFFGTYFLYNAVSIGRILNIEQLQSSGIYGMLYYFLLRLGTDPIPLIKVVLGVVPLSFSALFWLIPLIRSGLLKKENESIRRDNFRGMAYSRIWSGPEEVRPGELRSDAAECRPQNPEAARNLVIREMTSYSVPDVVLDEKQNEVYSFPELRREKDALEKYRLAVDPASFLPGKKVFDTAATEAEKRG
jgi:hypothetical protein